MNLYQIKYDKYDDEGYETIFMVHEKSMSQEEFQKCIKSARFEMEHYPSYESLPRYLEKYGFKRITTGYYEI